MQTIYDANQPQVSRAVIVNNLLNNHHSEFTPNDDQDQPDNHLPYDYATDGVPTLAETSTATPGETEITTTENEDSLSIVPVPTIFDEMNHNLSSEVEILNLCRHLRTPL